MTTPNAAQLIHLLIEERARRLGLLRWLKSAGKESGWPTEVEMGQARREIEAEVLTNQAGNTK